MKGATLYLRPCHSYFHELRKMFIISYKKLFESTFSGFVCSRVSTKIFSMSRRGVVDKSLALYPGLPSYQSVE